MKRNLLLFVVSMFTFTSFAQSEIGERFMNIDWEEDSVEIQTVSEILKLQQNISAVTRIRNQKDRIWGNRRFINVSLNTVSMTTKETDNPNAILKDREYKSNWGVSITRGKNIKLHQPIANILAFYLDFVTIDFGVNHYEYTDDAEKFDLNATFTDPKVGDGYNSACYYTPWDFEKYDINYGMRIGPSVTIAPFTVLNSPILSFIKFNVYWHWGYNASLSIIPKDDNEDHYVSYNVNYTGFGTRLNWSASPYTVFGLNVSWKKVGIGFETRKTTNEYKPLEEKFGKDTDLLNYNFETKATRFYLQYRF